MQLGRPLIGMNWSKSVFPSKFTWFVNLLSKTFCFSDFETVLKNIKYGLQGYDLLNLAPSKDNLHKLSMFAEYLFLVRLDNIPKKLSEEYFPDKITDWKPRVSSCNHAMHRLSFNFQSDRDFGETIP